MLNFVFNIEKEWYLLHNSPGCLTFKKSIIMQLKFFINIISIAFLTVMPIGLILFITRFIFDLSLKGN